MEANAGEYIKNYLHLKRFPRISLHCKLVPVQYREYEYGLLRQNKDISRLVLFQSNVLVEHLSCHYYYHKINYHTIDLVQFDISCI